MELMSRFNVSFTTKLISIIPKKIPKLAQDIANARKKSVLEIIIYDFIFHKNIKRIMLFFVIF